MYYYFYAAHKKQRKIDSQKATLKSSSSISNAQCLSKFQDTSIRESSNLNVFRSPCADISNVLNMGMVHMDTNDGKQRRKIRKLYLDRKKSKNMYDTGNLRVSSTPSSFGMAENSKCNHASTSTVLTNINVSNPFNCVNSGNFVTYSIIISTMILITYTFFLIQIFSYRFL
ncbi:hypothetical protein HanXRQr2_Chr13g0565321 [Helianthus annuus]|uniref:Uncharacterized protein n=1 Tax=Helianthus annuus TaxID=4232 RepID=A0A251SMS3_HELAN|nr:hypothetical protein HanXRQr2_Chr13g0565321 [Helianthus annuus]